MSKVRIKYIMELIFIFILPLLFVLCNVSIENTFVYDNEGNYQTSERSISYTPIAYTTKTITEVNFDIGDIQYGWNYTGYIYITLSNGFNSDFTGLELLTAFNSEYYIGFYENDYSNLVLFWDHKDELNESDTWALVDTIVYNDITYYKYDYDYSNADIPYAYDYGYYTYLEYTTETITQDSPIIQLKNILADVVQIDSTNATYNVVFDYTCLWFIMFIIWHLVYMFVDFLLHFWRKEEK